MKSIEGLRAYAGAVTAALALAVYLMASQGEDLLKVILVYTCFIFLPSFLIPYWIYKEDGDDTERDGA